MGLPEHDLYAVKYADRPGRRGDHFDRGAGADDPHADDSMSMDYFVWAITGGDRTWVVDTGFGRGDAEQRGRRLVRSGAEGLAAIGVDATAVTDVIVTHLHYDHIGGFDQFPRARFHVQDREVAFATGRQMNVAQQRHAYTAEHVAQFVRAVHAGRVVFHDGDADLAPGLSVHHVGGHTDGMQVVRASTGSGWVVLASDAAHFYDNLELGRPFPIAYDFEAVRAGFDRVVELAGSRDRYVPGHDPEVLRRHPAVGGLDGVACRISPGA